MQRIQHNLLSLGLFCALLSTSVLAQDAGKVNDTLLGATGPFEDMVGPALAKNDKGVAKRLAAADQQAEAVKKVLPTDAAQQFEQLLQTIHKAAESKDDMKMAENAVAVFRLLVDNLKADSLKIPKEVALLDYAGYKLQVLAAAERPDWAAMSKVAADADTWWQAIAKTKVSEKNLRATVTSTIGGLKQATQEKDLSMLKFAAQIDLDLVDLLEGHFKSKK